MLCFSAIEGEAGLDGSLSADVAMLLRDFGIFFAPIQYVM
jgi:hypothetical protein